MRIMVPSWVLSPLSSKPTPTSSIERNAFPPLMMPANSSTGFGSLRCSNDKISMNISVINGTEWKSERRMGLNENFLPLSLTIQAIP